MEKGTFGKDYRPRAVRSTKFDVQEVNGRPRQGLPQKDLIFFDGESGLLANFDAGFTTKAFFFINNHGLAVLKLIDFNRTDIHALATTDTFVDVDGNRITHDQPPKFFVIPAYAG
jgi:hypothetical protein